jgi:hypothetical protein
MRARIAEIARLTGDDGSKSTELWPKGVSIVTGE